MKQCDARPALCKATGKSKYGKSQPTDSVEPFFVRGMKASPEPSRAGLRESEHRGSRPPVHDRGEKLESCQG